MAQQVDMPLGVDDAGSAQPIFEDLREQQVFDEIGFDFLSYHLGRADSSESEQDRHGYGRVRPEEIAQLDAWARRRGKDYIVNNEGVIRERGDESLYEKPGLFFQMPSELVEFCRSSPYCLGICYDEVAHAITNGAWITILEGKYAPYFYDAMGDTLEQAYAGNRYNIAKLMDTRYSGFAENARQSSKRPVISGEYVFPVLNHLLGQAGIVPVPKYLKESVTPVTAAVALGAAKQYGLPYWACLDLWCGEYPGHSPRDLWSSLLFAYWTGAERAYIENLGYDGTNVLYKGSLYVKAADGVRLSPWGEVAKEFRQNYLPAHRRTFSSRDFKPEIVIVRFPDSDWGQEKTETYITGYLYGAPNLKPDPETRYWTKIWNVITHGTTSPIAVNYNNLSMGEPFRFFFPANNVAVYDHLASEPELYRSARLVFLAGKMISPECMATLGRLVREKGITVVTPTHLAPKEMGHERSLLYTIVPRGRGRWIVTDDVMHEEVVSLVQPYLGSPDELRYVFGNTEVIFTSPHPAEPIQGMTRVLKSEEKRPPMKSIEVLIDAAHVVGDIKPLHDVCNGPICLRGYHDFTSYYKELGIRNVRLHDVPYTFDNVQDINYVFPRMDADPNCADNYDFGQTDFYLESIASLGIDIIYRLGYSIEFEKSPLVHNVPPVSFENWATVCANIVRHYNRGWAKGKEMGIQYWEVWNEPDQKQFWDGTPQDFYQLYEATAKAIKLADPSVKVGGPALALDMDFLEGFLAHCRKHEVPLDFVSWHVYASDSQDVVVRAAQVRSLMAKCGYSNVESILDEWNYARADVDRQTMFTEQSGMPGAAFDAAVLIKLQDTPVDVATFYTGTNLVYGLFNAYGTPHKAYYSFLAFRRILDAPLRLAVETSDAEGLPALAGLSEDQKMIRILQSNTRSATRSLWFSVRNVPWAGSAKCTKQVVTSQCNLQSVSTCDLSGPSFTFSEKIEGTSVCLITIERTTG